MDNDFYEKVWNKENNIESNKKIIAGLSELENDINENKNFKLVVVSSNDQNIVGNIEEVKSLILKENNNLNYVVIKEIDKQNKLIKIYPTPLVTSA